MRVHALGFSILILFAASAGVAFASTTDGRIDETEKYAWGENIGWLNLNASSTNIEISSTGITGYMWGENIGWISLNCSNDSSCATVDYGITNTTGGSLGGLAWGENVGWIDFSPDFGGVGIDGDGKFTGYAWGENIGWIVFNCTTTASCGEVDYRVSTDWRPECNNGIDDDGDGQQDFPADAGCNSKGDGSEGSDAGSGGGGGAPPSGTPVSSTPEELKSTLLARIDDLAEFLRSLLPDVLQPGKAPIKEPEEPPRIEDLVPDTPQPVFAQVWTLFKAPPLKHLVLAPLPKNVQRLAKKFPSFKRTLSKVGLTRVPDLVGLKEVALVLPGVSDILRIPKGLSIARFTKKEIERLPDAVVFARGGAGKIDLQPALTMSARGVTTQRISSISGEIIQLVIKPDAPVTRIRGLLVLANQPRRIGTRPIRLINTAHAQESFEEYGEREVENRLVLAKFEYTDPDGDGLYTANIPAPEVAGTYEVITILEYEEISLGRKDLRLIVVVDPEGYVYESQNGREIRIADATVSLFWLNPETSAYQTWPAYEYNQGNPQITDITGDYSFLVPEGRYFLEAKAEGYRTYRGEPFDVISGRGVHVNIEIVPTLWWLGNIDWKTIGMVLIGLLLVYNFYHDRKRDRMVAGSIQPPAPAPQQPQPAAPNAIIHTPQSTPPQSSHMTHSPPQHGAQS